MNSRKCKKKRKSDILILGMNSKKYDLYEKYSENLIILNLMKTIKMQNQYKKLESQY
jgi:hypothetical protein